MKRPDGPATDRFVAKISRHESNSSAHKILRLKPGRTHIAVHRPELRPEITVSSGDDSFQLTMAGLSVGAQYEFQWWANFSSPGTNLHSATAGNTVVLNNNTSGQGGGTGQFALGTFTADASSQIITFDGPVFSLLNGFQLRQLDGNATNVPEGGATLPLLAIALTAVGLLHWKARASHSC